MRTGKEEYARPFIRIGLDWINLDDWPATSVTGAALVSRWRDSRCWPVMVGGWSKVRRDVSAMTFCRSTWLWDDCISTCIVVIDLRFSCVHAVHTLPACVQYCWLTVYAFDIGKLTRRRVGLRYMTVGYESVSKNLINDTQIIFENCNQHFGNFKP